MLCNFVLNSIEYLLAVQQFVRQLVVNFILVIKLIEPLKHFFATGTHFFNFFARLLDCQQRCFEQTDIQVGQFGLLLEILGRDNLLQEPNKKR